MVEHHLPVMNAPTGFGSAYDFPTNVGPLTSLQLGDLQVKLAGYYTYTLQLLGEQDSALGALRSSYEISLGMQMQALQDGRGTGTGSRVNKDNLRALAISNDDLLRRATEQLIAREATVTRLRAQSAVYSEQLTRLSREQTRREMESRIG